MNDPSKLRKATSWNTTRRKVLMGTATLAGTALLSRTGWTQGAAKTHLNYGVDRYPPNIRPFDYTGTAHASMKEIIHRGLLSYDTNGALQPELAESWDFDGNLVYSFKLKPGLVFHDGSPILADDVKFSLNEITREGSTAQMKNALSVIDTIEVIDQENLRITLKEPTATFLNLLAHFSTPIVSEKGFAANPEIPPGAGPFMIVKDERGVRFELKRFEQYHKPGLPKLETLSFINIMDENLRVAALESGDADLITVVPWQYIDQLQSNERLKVQSVEGAFMYLMFNLSDGPFTNPLVRRAVAHALKREDFVAAVYSGHGAPLQRLPIPESSPMYTERRPYFDYDLDKAKQLMEEAGYGSGFSTVILSTSSPEQHKMTGEILQQQLQAIGIKASLNLPEWGARITQGSRGQYGIAVNGTALDFNDPDGLSTLLVASKGSFRQSYGYKNEKIETLMAEGRSEIDNEKRKQIYAKIEDIVADDVPLVPLVWRAQAYAFDKKLKEFTNMPGFLNIYSSFTLERAYFEA